MSILTNVMFDEKLARFAGFSRQLQFGSIASNLNRLATYSEGNQPLEACLEIAREARYFCEVVARESKPDSLALPVALDGFLDLCMHRLSGGESCAELAPLARRFARAMTLLPS